MKKTLLIFACFILFAGGAFAYLPNEKVLRSFETIFINPHEVKWYDHKDYYEVSFVQGEIRSTVKFDTEGNFIGSTRYYQEQHLPANIIYKLKKKYADKSIFGVTEITNSDEVNYYIKMEDNKNWITIKASGNGQMELFEKYRKA